VATIETLQTEARRGPAGFRICIATVT
jgi:hypothetical protein